MSENLARLERLRAAIAAERDREQRRPFPDEAKLDRLQELDWEVRARLLSEERWAMGVAS